MKNRTKLKGPAIQSRAEVEAVVREIAELTLSRNRQQTEMDESITAIREQYEVTLGTVNKTLDQKTELVRAWAEANPSEFAGLKSLELIHGTVGWRIGNPTLKTLTGWTWDRVLEKMKTLARFVSYVRTKEEVNKQALLADRDPIGDEDLRKIGVRVVQEESFFVDPKIEQPENRQVTEAA